MHKSAVGYRELKLVRENGVINVYRDNLPVPGLDNISTVRQYVHDTNQFDANQQGTTTGVEIDVSKAIRSFSVHIGEKSDGKVDNIWSEANGFNSADRKGFVEVKNMWMFTNTTAHVSRRLLEKRVI